MQRIGRRRDVPRKSHKRAGRPPGVTTRREFLGAAPERRDCQSARGARASRNLRLVGPQPLSVEVEVRDQVRKVELLSVAQAEANGGQRADDGDGQADGG